MTTCVGSTVSFDVVDVRRGAVRTYDEDVTRVVAGRSGYPVVRFEGRFYELFRPGVGQHFIDLGRPLGRS